MSRTKIVVTLILGVALAVSLWVLVDAVRDLARPEGRAAPRLAYEEPEPEDAIEELPVPDVERSPARPLAIRVLGFGPDDRLLPAASLRLEFPGGPSVPSARAEESGEPHPPETVRLVDGAASFPARIRPRLATLVVESSAGLARFAPVLTGDARDDAPPVEIPGDGAPAEVLRQSLVDRPGGLSWTIGLLESREETVRPDGQLWLGVSALLAEDWGERGVVQVIGRTNLPDGTHVHGKMLFDGYLVASTFRGFEVRGGEWRLRLLLADDSRLLAGRFDLEVAFNARLEDASFLLELDDATRESITERSTEVFVRRKVSIGDPMQALAEDVATAAYYRELLERVVELRQRFRSRHQQLKGLGAGWDPRIARAHREAHAAWFREDFVDDEGRLEETAWRRFLDESWRPEVTRLLESHRARQNTKYREAESRAGALIDALLRLSRLYSKLDVYPIFGLRSDPSDQYIEESGHEDIGLLERLVEENLDRLQRFTRLGVPDPGEPPAAPPDGETGGGETGGGETGGGETGGGETGGGETGGGETGESASDASPGSDASPRGRF